MALVTVPRHHIRPVGNVSTALRTRRIAEARMLRLDMSPQARKLDGRRATLPLAADPDLVPIHAHVRLRLRDCARPRRLSPLLIGRVVELVTLAVIGMDMAGRLVDAHILLLLLLAALRTLRRASAAQRPVNPFDVAPELRSVGHALPATTPLADYRSHSGDSARSLLRTLPLPRDRDLRGRFQLGRKDPSVSLFVARRGGGASRHRRHRS